MEQRVTTAEKALEIAKQKANLLSTQDKGFYDYKGREKAQKQSYYDKGFRHVENSTGPVIFQARKFGFMECWMAAMNAIGLPADSPFRNTDQVTHPEDPAIGAQAGDEEEEISGEEEGAKSLES